jgi:hypothetical protein
MAMKRGPLFTENLSYRCLKDEVLRKLFGPKKDMWAV